MVPISGGAAFVPRPLPRDVALPVEILPLLGRASRALGELNGMGRILPDPYILVRPFMRREAVLSSMIEATQTLVADLLLFESSDGRVDVRGDAREVANYVAALEHGIDALQSLPLSVRLLNDMHEILMRGVRGKDRRPGQLRDSQVIIGPPGASIADAEFVPPPAEFVRDLLFDLEQFMNEDNTLDPLVECALVHYQFETIHPYLDGNGRIGRLLIVLLLCARGVLSTPLLYLSAYFEKNREAYYNGLNSLRQAADWNDWLRFFLTGVEEQSIDAIERAGQLLALKREYTDRLAAAGRSGRTFALLEYLFQSPVLTRSRAADILDVTAAGAKGIIERLCEEKILEIMPGRYPTTYVARGILDAVEVQIGR